MPSERIQRQIDAHLDATERAGLELNWTLVQEHAWAALALDPENEDAPVFLAAAERRLASGGPHPPAPFPAREGGDPVPRAMQGGETAAPPALGKAETPGAPPSPHRGGIGSPQANQGEVGLSFANGRYQVTRLLGEGATKRVYLAHDTRLDRDVAFALIRTEGLDEEGLARIRREAQAMGRLGDHPNIVTVYDIGEENGQPYIVSQLMAGGSLESLIDQAEGHRLPFEEVLRLGDQIAQALEHAHRHGIVHRDLKPGNVWLTAPQEQGEVGTHHSSLITHHSAKLGDFGLALALDRSRLTQSGMMVGTVSYMPPEQALAGEVTPRSDLYSLGCVLYEMVTGRPPFVAEESIAIITQALNVPPVFPTWHRPDCPPALEALILRLLEKDPSRRPASASEVRGMLTAIDLAPPVHTGFTQLQPVPYGAQDNPLYRRTFVGREPELRQLQSLFDQALSGQGSLVMVVGEPGIGKTALCEQMATYAAVRGGRTLVGHCYEEGSFSLPYLAFVEALRTYVLARPPEALRDELGTGAADVARIVSEVRERLDVDLRQAGDPEEDRWRLLQAVTSFLQNAASAQPLVLVLEDLHWADRGTLDLLTHLVRSLAGARLLVVGTYRDVEVDRAHPLAATLGELRRGTPVARVLLRGLTADEVSRMMSSLADQEVPWGLAEAVHRQTEGNPLFIQEVVRYLVEEGLITREAGAHGRTPLRETSLQIAIPEGLRDVIGRRLSKLSPECNRLLSIAAVIGRDFLLETLHAVANQSEEQVLAGIEEATRVGVLEDRTRGGTLQYRFAHAFFRQTLYEELFTPRRLRTHQQVARVLERQYAGRLEEHAAELVEHFAQSSDPVDIRKAVLYGEMAARRAMGVYAYGEAVRLLEEALEAQDEADPGDKARRCDLLLSLGEALMPAGEPRRAFEEAAEQAFALAEEMADAPRAIAACWIAYRATFQFGGTPIFTTPIARLWIERYDRYAAPGTVDRVHVDRRLADIRREEGHNAEAWALDLGALDLARRLGEIPTILQAANPMLNFGGGPENIAVQRQLAQEMLAYARRDVGADQFGGMLGRIGPILLSWGERPAAEELWRQLEEFAERTRHPNPVQILLWAKGGLAALGGDLEGALVFAERLVQAGEEFGGRVRAQVLARVVSFRPRLWLGQGEEELAALSPAVAESPVTTEPYTAALLANLGRRDEARTTLEGYLERYGIGHEPDGTRTGYLLLLLEAAVLVGDRERSAMLSQRLAPAAHLVLAGSSAWSAGGPTCIALHLGGAATLLGDREQARRYYEQALEVCATIGFRPEIALTRLQMAELCLEEAEGARRAPLPGVAAPDVGAHGVRPDAAALLREAQDHLAFCIPEFREMKMQPSLERAEELRGRMGAG